MVSELWYFELSRLTANQQFRLQRFHKRERHLRSVKAGPQSRFSLHFFDKGLPGPGY